ncbi:carboxylesterase family protein [Demequina sp. NBRC 110052]|uniref:carboxylesterase family protein n=1 Tax=Demequina sp. NBRC 110052 TaxID=1570341 RepID=UPI0013565E81|nr:carboxylesterase family protein [Demequina sp. NBRC 110052]
MSSEDTTVVETALGPVVAHRDGDLWRARGIPYATAERYARPSPATPWSEPFDASRRASVSPQHPDGLMASVSPDYLERLGMDEQCQRVTVTWPAEPAPDAGDGSARGLPVVVWVHGGSYLTGGGDLDGFDPALLAREQRVIVVSVTYRLGLLGWVGGGDVPANLGLLDILEALRWVRACAMSFGGDPTRITAMGQSAGADAIAALLTVPEARGLFRRAILQSAPLGIGGRRDAMYRTILRAVDRPERDGDLDIDRLHEAHERTYAVARRHGLKGLMPLGPQWGHYPLPLERERTAALEEARDVDLMVGHMSDEGVLAGAAIPALGRAFRAPVVGGTVRRATAGRLQEAVYERSAARLVASHREAGGRAVHYVLGWRATGSRIADGHGMDIPVLLGEPEAWVHAEALKKETPDRLRKIGAALRQAWGDFIRDGEIAPASATAASEWLTLS